MPRGVSEGLRARLEALRERGVDSCEPLWLDVLPPDQALAELSGRAGPVFDLQRARFLSELGRDREASSILERLSDLPEGLSALRDRLRETLECAPTEPHEGVGPSEPSSTAAARLASWLDRVHQWRSDRRV